MVQVPLECDDGWASWVIIIIISNYNNKIKTLFCQRGHIQGYNVHSYKNTSMILSSQNIKIRKTIIICALNNNSNKNIYELKTTLT